MEAKTTNYVSNFPVTKIINEVSKFENEEIKVIKKLPLMTFGSLFKSFILKAATVGIVWGVGYMNWNFVWLIPPVAYVVLTGEKLRHENFKRLTAQATAIAQEKTIIEGRIDELPSWVYFPDYDRAEWLNGILYKMWPSINSYARDLCRSIIQETIRQRLIEYQIPGLGGDFFFERLILGRIPPKINGVKAYDKHTARNEIVLDVDLMYAGDCDITFSVGNFKAGIKDFQIRGMLRVTLKPLLPVEPIVGGVQVFFLKCPIIDFNLVGVADVLDLPGLNDVLRKLISDQIASLFVLPNKFSMSLSQAVPSEMIKTPEPEGVLRIHVVQAKHLMKKDIGVLGKGKSDPYAVITIGAQEFKTKIIDNTVDPKWDFWCECVISSAIAQQLNIEVWDFDDTKKNEHLGRATLEIGRVKKKGLIDTWVSLELAKHGMIHLRLMWLQLSTEKSDLAAAVKEIQELQDTSMSAAILILYIDSAKNLPCLKGTKQPDAYLEASVGSKIEKTGTLLRSSNPVWEQGFTMLVSNPETATLNLKIFDAKTTTSIGELIYNISTLLTMVNLETKLQPYDLQKSGVESKVVFSVALKILKYEKPEIISDDEEDHNIQTLKKKIEHQESTVSAVVPDSLLEHQPLMESKSSVQNMPFSADSQNTFKREAEATFVQDSVSMLASAHFPQNSKSLIRRTSSMPFFAEGAKLGRIQISLRYSIQRQKLVIVIHKIQNLPLSTNDPTNIPDPYVKLYLLPDKHKETKRKTATIKDNCSPVFDEQFEYILSQEDIKTRILDVSVCTQKGWLSTGNKCIGQIQINLSEIDLAQSVTSWYDLRSELKELKKD